MQWYEIDNMLVCCGLTVCYILFQNRGKPESVEMINGGYGIKNPTFEAPKAPDTPDVDGKNSGGNSG